VFFRIANKLGSFGKHHGWICSRSAESFDKCAYHGPFLISRERLGPYSAINGYSGVCKTVDSEKIPADRWPSDVETRKLNVRFPLAGQPRGMLGALLQATAPCAARAPLFRSFSSAGFSRILRSPCATAPLEAMMRFRHVNAPVICRLKGLGHKAAAPASSLSEVFGLHFD